ILGLLLLLFGQPPSPEREPALPRGVGALLLLLGPPCELLLDGGALRFEDALHLPGLASGALAEPLLGPERAREGALLHRVPERLLVLGSRSHEHREDVLAHGLLVGPGEHAAQRFECALLGALGLERLEACRIVAF